jgi:hypothetical protein
MWLRGPIKNVLWGKTYEHKKMITKNSPDYHPGLLGLPFPSSSLPDPMGKLTVPASTQ